MNRSEDRLLPVPYGAAASASDAGERRSAASRSIYGAARAGAYDAQVIGQTGHKRGLRGGAPVLQAARAAYLGVEYCGEHDRRPPVGLIKRTSI